MAVKKSVAVERRSIVGLYRRLFAPPMHSAGLARRPYSVAVAAIMTVLIIGSIIASRGAAATAKAAAQKRLPAREAKAGSGSDLKACRPVAAGRTFAVKALTILALAAAGGAIRAVRRAEKRLIERVIKPAIATGPAPTAGTIQPVAYRLFQSLRLAFEPLTDQLGVDQRFL